MNLCVQSGGVLGQYNFKEGYKLIKDSGFSSIDMNIDTAFDRNVLKTHMNEGRCIFEKSVDEIVDYYAEELAAIKEAGLNIYQAHAPFPAYIKEVPEFTEYCIGIYKKCILFCDRVGCKHLIIHGISLSRDDKTHTMEDIVALNYHMYESLIDTVKDTNVVICLENLFTGYDGAILEGVCSNPFDAIEIIDNLNAKAGKECFGLCCDTGHLNILGKNQYCYITQLGKRIKAFHIHDNDGKRDLHLAPYTGTIDWDAFCRAVRDIGFEGDLSFETFRQYSKARGVDKRAVAPFLRLVADIGNMFIEKTKE